MAKIIEDTLTCVEDGAPVKTKVRANAWVNAYTVLDKVMKVKAQALVYTQPHTFPEVQAKSVTYTLSAIKAETPVDTLTDASRSYDRDTR